MTTTRTFRTHGRRWLALGCALLVGVAGACGGGDDDDARRAGRRCGRKRRGRRPGRLHRRRHGGQQREDHAAPDAGADEFNDGDAEVDGRCVFVRPRSASSGNAANLIVEGWPNPEVNGEPPVIWSPAASAWAGIVNERAGSELAPAGTPFMLTPLVIAMPQPMAEALGWPDEPIGFADLRELANDPEGWGVGRPPGVGPVPARQDESRTTRRAASTSRSPSTTRRPARRAASPREDLQRPAAVEFATDIESSVVHYGDITMTFLNNWFAADQRGTALTYASAVAVEEKSVIDYNLRRPRRRARRRRGATPAARAAGGDLPRGGHALLRQPVHHPRHRVGRRRRARRRGAVRGLRAAAREPGTGDGVRLPPEQPRRAVGGPIVAENGVDPNQPQAELGVPEPACWSASSTRGPSCARRRGAARARRLRVDERRRPATVATKLDLAKAAAISALDEFKDEDEVGLWVFSTDLGGEQPELASRSCRSADRARTATRRAEQIDAQIPTAGTPLYDVTQVAYETMLEEYDPATINAIVLLTDGDERRRDSSDDDAQFETLIDTLEGPRGRVDDAGARVHDRLRRRRRRRARCGRSARPAARPRTTPATRPPSTRSSRP